MAHIQEIMAHGVGSGLARMLGANRLHTIVAAGADQAGATPLVANFCLLATASDGQGVRLGYAREAAITTLFCIGPEDCLVYPAEDERINDQAADAPVRLRAGYSLLAVPAVNRWLAVVSAADGGVVEAPTDGELYARQDGEWVELPPILPDAPANHVLYGRQDNAWEPVSAGPGGGVLAVTAGDGLLVDGVAGETITEIGTLSLDAPVAVALGGTGAAAAGGQALDNISGFSTTGYVQRTGAGAYALGPLPIIAASDVGMNPAAADNSAALAAALTSRNGIIDGGHQTFRFTQAGGTDTTPGPLYLAAASGVRGLRNMVLDFSACTADRYCLYPKGYPPGQPQALTADLSADADPTVIIVASAANFSVGQPVLLRSGAVWCPNGFGTSVIGGILPWHLTEFNRVIGIAGNQLTLEAPTANDFLVADQAYVAPLSSGPTGAWAPLAFHLDNVTIIGAGAARTADVQFGLRLLYAQGSRINAAFRDCWDTSCQVQVSVDTVVNYIKASDSGGLGRGYCFVSAGCWRTQVVTAVAENCNQVVDTSGTQLSFGSVFRVLDEDEWGMPQRDAEALAGAVQFDCVDRGTHVNSIMTSGDYHAGAAFNSHPPAAQTWVDCVIGTSKLAGSDGQFVYMGGYQQGIGTLIAPFSAGVVCLLQYAGGRDKYGPAWYRVGSINVGGTGSNNGIPLLVQGLSFDPTRRLDFVDVKSIATGADCKRAIRLDSTSGPIGMVNIGASVIAAADPNYSGIELICGAGGYSLGRLRLADSYISTVSTTKPVVSVSTAGVTIPEVNLTNCTLAGGSYGLTGASARFSLTGQVKILNPATAPYSMDAASYVEIFGGSPADRWAPSASGSYQLKASKTEVAPSAGGFTHTFLLPVGFYAGQEFAVAMLANGDASSVWTPASGQAITGMPALLDPYSAVRARFDGVSAWSRIGSEVAAAIPGNTPGAVMGFDASGAAAASAALTSRFLVKGGAPGVPTASPYWAEDASFNLAANYAGIGSTSSRGLAITAADGASGVVSGGGFAAPGLIVTGTRYGGTSAARLPTENNIAMFNLNAQGWDGAAVQTRATIQYYSAEAWGVGNNGAKIRFSATPVGSAALAQGAVLEADGTWYVGSNASSTAVNTGAGTVNVAAGYYLNNKNVTPGSLQVAQSSPANPAGTTNPTGVMMGLGVTITPQATSRVMISISGDVLNTGAIGNGATVQIYRSTGTPPANGAALVGVVAGGRVNFVNAATGQKAPFALNGIVSGLTPGVATWIDLGVQALVGGTAAVENLSITAFEL